MQFTMHFTALLDLRAKLNKGISMKVHARRVILGHGHRSPFLYTFIQAPDDASKIKCRVASRILSTTNKPNLRFSKNNHTTRHGPAWFLTHEASLQHFKIQTSTKIQDALAPKWTFSPIQSPLWSAFPINVPCPSITVYFLNSKQWIRHALRTLQLQWHCMQYPDFGSKLWQMIQPVFPVLIGQDH